MIGRGVSYWDGRYYDERELEREARRVFDVCHGCRMCNSYCNAFPVLMEAIDTSPTGELDSVPSWKFKTVADNCTSCDICYVNCPYIAPHKFNLDFPRLMRRFRAMRYAKSFVGGKIFGRKIMKECSESKVSEPVDPKYIAVKDGVNRDLQLNNRNRWNFMDVIQDIDFMARILGPLSTLVNYTLQIRILRRLLSWIAKIHPDSRIPEFVPTRHRLTQFNVPMPNPNGNAKGKKVLIYATCFGNYFKPQIGEATAKVLTHNGVHVQIYYDHCCGMPQLETGNIASVILRAQKISKKLEPFINEGFAILTPVASCTFMFKKEWPNLLPNDPIVQFLAQNTFDISEYIVNLNSLNLLAPIPPLNASVTLHHACHSRSQTMGFKSLHLLKLIPQLQIHTLERCSGHGGIFGIKSNTYPSALKVGKLAFSKTLSHSLLSPHPIHYIASDCPLSSNHLLHGVKMLSSKKKQLPVHKPFLSLHPIQLLASAYNLQYP